MGSSPATDRKIKKEEPEYGSSLMGETIIYIQVNIKLKLTKIA